MAKENNAVEAVMMMLEEQYTGTSDEDPSTVEVVVKTRATEAWIVMKNNLFATVLVEKKNLGSHRSWGPFQAGVYGSP